jgi:hypothetical protein
MGGRLLVPRMVVRELQTLTDAATPVRAIAAPRLRRAGAAAPERVSAGRDGRWRRERGPPR